MLRTEGGTTIIRPPSLSYYNYQPTSTTPLVWISYMIQGPNLLQNELNDLFTDCGVLKDADE